MEAPINLEGIKETIRLWLVQKVVSVISTNTVKELLTFAVELLKEKTAESEIIFDDWIAEAFENIVKDDSKIQIITDFIKSKFSGNICMETRPQYGLDEYDELTSIVMGRKPIDDRRCESGKFEFWFSMLLRVVVPIIVEYLKDKKNDNEEKE